MKTVITCLCLMMLLSSCSTNTRLREECIKTVATYGQAVECMIKLNDKQ
jgi:hypothetical protein